MIHHSTRILLSRSTRLTTAGFTAKPSNIRLPSSRKFFLRTSSINIFKTVTILTVKHRILIPKLIKSLSFKSFHKVFTLTLITLFAKLVLCRPWLNTIRPSFIDSTTHDLNMVALSQQSNNGSYSFFVFKLNNRMKMIMLIFAFFPSTN